MVFNLLSYDDKRGMVESQNWVDKTHMNVNMSFPGIFWENKVPCNIYKYQAVSNIWNSAGMP